MNMPDPIFHIEVDKIKSNPFQPRRVFDETALKELAESIREFGILHPLVVTKVEIPTEFGADVEYQLVAGERRLMAAKIAGLERVPAIVKSALTDRERLELSIIENIQRENLNPIETARAYARLQDQFGLAQREIAARVGKSREVVANAVRLLSLPSQIQDALSERRVSESQARLMLMISSPKEQQDIFENLLRENLSVRELRKRIQASKTQTEFKPAPPKADPEVEALEEKLREVLGTSVSLQKEGEGGKLLINFYSQEELLAIVGKLTETKKVLANQEESGVADNKEEFVV